ncbi:dehydrogenase [Arthrobacter sp. Hiyo6]|nr:dehydrogenase [Arthrobacter sp. Hiyo6]
MTISADHTAPGQLASQQAAPDHVTEGAAAEAVRKFGITVEDYMLPARHPIQIVDQDAA